MKLLLSAAVTVLCLYSIVEVEGQIFTPEFSCGNMSLEDTTRTPLNPNDSESTPTITVTPTMYKDAEAITVAIFDGNNFLNAMVRTKCTSCSNPRQDIGSFEKLDMDLELFDCDNIAGSAAVAIDYSSREHLNMTFKPNPGVREEFVFEYSVLLQSADWFRSLISVSVRPEALPDTTTIPGSAGPDSGNGLMSSSSSRNSPYVLAYGVLLLYSFI